MQGLLGTTLILLAACSLAAMATAAFRVPALLGYLSVGVVLGPSVIGVIAPGETLSFLSELGVALLLFMVGLEFSLGDFWLARRTVLMAGALQMIAVAPPLILLLMWLGRDVAVGQLGRRDDRVLGDADLVVRLEGVAQAAQNHDGLGHRRLGHRHRLEAPLQCGILLDVFLVLVQRRGADQVEFTARHHRFEHVGHVQPAFATALAGTDDGVHLVDEQNQLALVLGHLLQHLLHALLELAAIFGAGHHGVDVEFHQALVAQGLGHFTRHHALRQPFDDGGLAHTRLADQHRVVFLAPGQHAPAGTPHCHRLRRRTAEGYPPGCGAAFSPAHRWRFQP